jgi:23S rRNA pseudouridine1911/1915/1917 synthase
MIQKFKITEQDRGKRLDKFLVENIEELSRNQAKRLINQKRIEVNGEPASPSHLLISKEEVRVKSLTASASPDGREFIFDDLEIVEDNENFLVVNKPAGLIVHASKYIKEDTLVYLLLQQYPEIEGVGDSPDRPGIVHRLDKEVSGLMVIAKDRENFYHLKRQFGDRRVQKIYQALVYGYPPRERELIDVALKRSPKTGKVITVAGKEETGGAKEAETEYEVVRHYKNYTLLQIRLYTGRTHQIRAHLKSKGVPIVGDGLYATRKAKVWNKKIGLDRVFLVACNLGFYDMEGDFRDFEIELPERLKHFLNKIN